MQASYGAFRSHFGPDVLKSLDGPALLNAMHTHGNKESLVYWLEFKKDDEFPGPTFGSIAGGSAHKAYGDEPVGGGFSKKRKEHF